VEIKNERTWKKSQRQRSAWYFNQGKCWGPEYVKVREGLLFKRQWNDRSDRKDTKAISICKRHSPQTNPTTCRFWSALNVMRPSTEENWTTHGDYAVIYVEPAPILSTPTRVLGIDRNWLSRFQLNWSFDWCLNTWPSLSLLYSGR